MPGIRDPYTFTFSVEESELLLQGLGKLPAERSYNLLTRMAQEIGQENQRRQSNAGLGGIAGGLSPEQAVANAGGETHNVQ